MSLLALCHFTLVEAEPPAFVDIAAEAGFTAVRLVLQFPRSCGPGFPMAGGTRMRRETRRRLDATGAAAGRLTLRGEVDVTQGARVVDIAVARGPVRMRRHRPG